MKVSKIGFKTKALVAAMALAASGMASAFVLPATGSGDLIFSIWDPTVGREASVSVDMGIDLDTAVAALRSGATMVTTLGNIFNNTTYIQEFGFATHNVADLRWNIVAADTAVSDSGRGLVTGAVGSNMQMTNAGTQDLASVSANFFGKFEAVNAGGAHNPLDPKFAGEPTIWGPNVAGTVSQGSATGIGGSLDMFYFINTVGGSGYADDPNAFAAREKFTNGTGIWTVSTNGNVGFTPTSAGPVPPAVPVPAAVWLLGSALVGLVGVARRRNSEAA